MQRLGLLKERSMQASAARLSHNIFLSDGHVKDSSAECRKRLFRYENCRNVYSCANAASKAVELTKQV